MKPLHNIIIAVLVLLICIRVYGQETEYYNPEDSVAIAGETQQKDKRMFYSMSGGTGFMSFGNSDGFFSSWLMPSVGYKMTNNFSLETGLILLNGNNFSLGEGEDYVNRCRSTFIALSGKYRVSPDVIVFGSVLKEIAAGNTLPGESFSMGFEYKIGENSYIGFSMQFSNGIRPLNRGYSGFNRQYHSFYGW